MRTANLHLYPVGAKPECLLFLKIDRCLQFLLPYIDVCRSSNRVDDVVAEISFTDGCSIWFASSEGVIDMALDQPRIRVSLRWLALLPFLMRQGVPQKHVSNEEIRNLVSSVYDKAAT